MIQEQTILKVHDNSGAKQVKCIKVLNGFKSKLAKQGDIIVVSILSLRNKFKHTSKVKKGEIYKALLLKTNSVYTSKTGVKYFFKDNSVCLLNKQGKPLGTRIIGSITKNLKKHKWLKLVSLSSGLI